jgi:hypothetical protein
MSYGAIRQLPDQAEFAELSKGRVRQPVAVRRLPDPAGSAGRRDLTAAAKRSVHQASTRSRHHNAPMATAC